MEGLTPSKVAVAQWWWWWLWHSCGLARRNWELRMWDGGALTRPWCLGCYLQGKTGKRDVSENVHSFLWKAASWNLLRSRIFSFVDKGGNLQF